MVSMQKMKNWRTNASFVQILYKSFVGKNYLFIIMQKRHVWSTKILKVFSEAKKTFKLVVKQAYIFQNLYFFDWII